MTEYIDAYTISDATGN